MDTYDVDEQPNNECSFDLVKELCREMPDMESEIQSALYMAKEKAKRDIISSDKGRDGKQESDKNRHSAKDKSSDGERKKFTISPTQTPIKAGGSASKQQPKARDAADPGERKECPNSKIAKDQQQTKAMVTEESSKKERTERAHKNDRVVETESRQGSKGDKIAAAHVTNQTTHQQEKESRKDNITIKTANTHNPSETRQVKTHKERNMEKERKLKLETESEKLKKTNTVIEKSEKEHNTTTDANKRVPAETSDTKEKKVNKSSSESVDENKRHKEQIKDSRKEVKKEGKNNGPTTPDNKRQAAAEEKNSKQVKEEIKEKANVATSKLHESKKQQNQPETRDKNKIVERKKMDGKETHNDQPAKLSPGSNKKQIDEPIKEKAERVTDKEKPKEQAAEPNKVSKKKESEKTILATDGKESDVKDKTEARSNERVTKEISNKNIVTSINNSNAIAQQKEQLKNQRPEVTKEETTKITKQSNCNKDEEKKALKEPNKMVENKLPTEQINKTNSSEGNAGNDSNSGKISPITENGLSVKIELGKINLKKLAKDSKVNVETQKADKNEKKELPIEVSETKIDIALEVSRKEEAIDDGSKAKQSNAISPNLKPLDKSNAISPSNLKPIDKSNAISPSKLKATDKIEDEKLTSNNTECKLNKSLKRQLEDEPCSATVKSEQQSLAKQFKFDPKISERKSIIEIVISSDEKKNMQMDKLKGEIVDAPKEQINSEVNEIINVKVECPKLDAVEPKVIEETVKMDCIEEKSAIEDTTLKLEDKNDIANEKAEAEKQIIEDTTLKLEDKNEIANEKAEAEKQSIEDTTLKLEDKNAMAKEQAEEKKQRIEDTTSKLEDKHEIAKEKAEAEKSDKHECATNKVEIVKEECKKAVTNSDVQTQLTEISNKINAAAAKPIIPETNLQYHTQPVQRNTNGPEMPTSKVQQTTPIEPKNCEAYVKPKGKRKISTSSCSLTSQDECSNSSSQENQLSKDSSHEISLTLAEEALDGEYRRTCQPFLQHLPCFKLKIPENTIAKCRECRRRKAANQQTSNDVYCRFYEFRRLQYNAAGELSVAGFPNPYLDPKREDLNIWQPDEHTEPTAGYMDIQVCRYILLHVADQFCYLWRQEVEALDLHENPDDTIAWKKVVQGIREICDVCDTTLFNFHWTCASCGFGVCIDCFKDRKEKRTCRKTREKTQRGRDEYHWLLCSGTTQHPEKHELKKLMLTQIIAGNSLNELGRLMHHVRMIWKIPQLCGCLLSREKMNIPGAENLIDDMIKQSRLQEQTSASSLATEETKRQQQRLEKIHEKKLLYARSLGIDYVPGRKWTKETLGKDPITHAFDDLNHINFLRPGLAGLRRFLPPRVLMLINTTVEAPGVPHEVLCNGKLLLLTNPINPDNRLLFQDVWKSGQPVMISNVARSLDLDLWRPEAFCRDFGDKPNDLINCLNGNLVPNQPMRFFWEGFQSMHKRLLDHNGKPMLLKLKDWPPGDDFAEILPTRYADLMKGLPMPEYTLRTGNLNLASCLPKMFVPPDLGPKMYNAYGSALHPDKGTTNLHLDISDAVNIMVYVGIPEDSDSKAQITAANRAIAMGGCDYLTRARLYASDKTPVPGAIWHIFAAHDTDKIRDLLNRVTLERGFRLEPDHDPIHDQNWYLDDHLRARLYEEYQVESYPIVQCLGDAVFIPAGAPHQVQNLHNCIKVAEDFVSPENITHCYHLTHEFRRLSSSHTNHEDKLQIKNIIYHAVKDCCTILERALDKRLKMELEAARQRIAMRERRKRAKIGVEGNDELTNKKMRSENIAKEAKVSIDVSNSHNDSGDAVSMEGRRFVNKNTTEAEVVNSVSTNGTSC